jgi:hypothetical protein
MKLIILTIIANCICNFLLAQQTLNAGKLTLRVYLDTDCNSKRSEGDVLCTNYTAKLVETNFLYTHNGSQDAQLTGMPEGKQVLYITHNGNNNSFYAINQTITVKPDGEFLEALLITSCSKSSAPTVYTTKAERVIFDILTKTKRVPKKQNEKPKFPDYFKPCTLLSVANDSIKSEDNEKYYNQLSFKYDKSNRIIAIIPSSPKQPTLYIDYVPNSVPEHLMIRSITYKSPNFKKTRALIFQYNRNFVTNYRYRLESEMLVEFDGDTIPRTTSRLQSSQYFYSDKLDSIQTSYTYAGKNYRLINYIFTNQINGDIKISKKLDKVGGGTTTINNLVAKAEGSDNYFYFNYKPLYYYINGDNIFGEYNGMCSDPFHQLFTNEIQPRKIYKIDNRNTENKPVLDFGFDFINTPTNKQKPYKISFTPDSDHTGFYFINWNCSKK